MRTRNDVIAEITTTIEAGGEARAAEYHLDRIADECFAFDETNGYRQASSDDEFWDSVRRHYRSDVIIHDGVAWQLLDSTHQAWLYGWHALKPIVLIAGSVRDLDEEAHAEIDRWEDQVDTIHHSLALSAWSTFGEGPSEADLWADVQAERASGTDLCSAEDAYLEAARLHLTSNSRGIAAVLDAKHSDGSGFAIPVTEAWLSFQYHDTVNLSPTVALARWRFLELCEQHNLAVSFDVEEES